MSDSHKAWHLDDSSDEDFYEEEKLVEVSRAQSVPEPISDPHVEILQEFINQNQAPWRFVINRVSPKVDNLELEQTLRRDLKAADFEVSLIPKRGSTGHIGKATFNTSQLEIATSLIRLHQTNLCNSLVIIEPDTFRPKNNDRRGGRGRGRDAPRGRDRMDMQRPQWQGDRQGDRNVNKQDRFTNKNPAYSRKEGPIQIPDLTRTNTAPPAPAAKRVRTSNPFGGAKPVDTKPETQQESGNQAAQVVDPKSDNKGQKQFNPFGGARPVDTASRDNEWNKAQQQPKKEEIEKKQTPVIAEVIAIVEEVVAAVDEDVPGWDDEDPVSWDPVSWDEDPPTVKPDPVVKDKKEYQKRDNRKSWAAGDYQENRGDFQGNRGDYQGNRGDYQGNRRGRGGNQRRGGQRGRYRRYERVAGQEQKQGPAPRKYSYTQTNSPPPEPVQTPVEPEPVVVPVRKKSNAWATPEESRAIILRKKSDASQPDIPPPAPKVEVKGKKGRKYQEKKQDIAS